MNVRQTLICFFLLSLQDGNRSLIGAQNHIITEKEGGNIRHKCTFRLSGRRRIFCREKCEDKKDILINTTKVRDENGRYSIEYTEGTYPVSSTVLYVIITNLTKSDSGQYRCSLDRWILDSSEDFEVKVEDAPVTPTPIWTPQPFSPSVPLAFTPMTTKPTITTTTTTTQSLSSSSGSSSSSSASTEDTKQSQQQQTAGGPGVLLSVRLTLVIMIIVSSAAVLIFCRKRISKPAEAGVDAEYVNVSEAIQMSEIREEDRRSRSPPAEISTVYSVHRSQVSEKNGRRLE